MGEKAAFIVTTYCTADLHRYYLHSCLDALVTWFEGHHIYVLYSGEKPDYPQQQDVSFHQKEYEDAGELNPYFFVLSAECGDHPQFCFIHDSVVLKYPFKSFMDDHDRDEVCILWNASSHIHQDVLLDENAMILDTFCIRGETAREHFQRNWDSLFLVFGGMTLFTKEFSQKMMEVSNLREVAPLFQNKHHRCLWERLMSLLMIAVYGEEGAFQIPVLLGDIFLHPQAFRNQVHDCMGSDVATKMWANR